MVQSTNIQEINALIGQHSYITETIRKHVSQNIIGQSHLIESLLIGLISGGHVLLEGVPGLAKTLAIKTLASAVDAEYKRIQFTPDLLPADVIGTMVYNIGKDAFEVKKGPIFSNFILADEINRAPAKVQSALLEAMQERQVTIGNHSYDLDPLFLVLATQNPIEQEGTYTLPEAQVDRFLMKVNIGYPTKAEEKQIVDLNLEQRNSFPESLPKVSNAEVFKLRELANAIYIDEKIKNYIIDLVFAIRSSKDYGISDLENIIAYGASPRASISLAICSKSHALLEGRAYVIPDDVKDVAHDVLRHRIGLTYEAEATNIISDDVITNILNKVAVP